MTTTTTHNYLPFGGSTFVGHEECIVFYRKPDGRLGLKQVSILAPVKHAVGTHHASDDLLAELAKLIKEEL